MSDKNADSSVGDVGQWLGVLLTGLVGAFSFIGIKGDEVGVLLRNEVWAPSLVALLIALALGASTVSIFLAKKSSPWPFALALIVLAASLGPMASAALPMPNTRAFTRQAAGLVAAGILLVSLLLFAYSIATRSTFKGPRWSTQAAVLLVAVILSTTAVYSALRLESRSQRATTSAQVAASFDRTDGGGGSTMNLTLKAAKLRAGDDVSVSVYGLPREADIEAKCGDSGLNRLLKDAAARLSAETSTDKKNSLIMAYSDTCQQQPCANLSLLCKFVAGAQLKPDAFGTLDSTIKVPVDPSTFQHLAVRAAVCVRDGSGKCQSRDTTLDVRLPKQ